MRSLTWPSHESDETRATRTSNMVCTFVTLAAFALRQHAHFHSLRHMHMHAHRHDAAVCCSQQQSTALRALEALPADSLPAHLAVIMDGNARWARRHGRPVAAGHVAGVEALRTLVASAIAVKPLQTLTVYAFSSENFGRPPDEVAALLRLIESTLEREANGLHDRGVRLAFVGDLERLPGTLRALVDRLTSRAPPDSERLVLVVALAYGGRQEIVATASQLAAQVARGALKADAIDELLFSETLRMRGAGLRTTMSDPDLLLRTGGHRRLSNFMLFQCAYTELHTVDVLWPDFSEHDLVGVLKEYSGRRRTFGVRM